MDTLHDDFNKLDLREVQLNTTECLLDRDARILEISGWSQCLTNDAVITLTIVDETDELEWTCMIKCSARNRRTDDEFFQVKVSSSSIDHIFAVTTQVLRRSNRFENTDCYEVTSESSCTAKASSTRVCGIASLAGAKLQFLHSFWHRSIGWHWSQRTVHKVRLVIFDKFWPPK